MLPLNLFTVLADQAAVRPRATFLVFEGEGGEITEIDYGEQLRRASATAAALAGLGVGVGHRVHLMMTNRPEFLDVLFGCALLGAVVVPVNPLSTAEEVAQQIEDSRASLSIVDPDRRQTAVAARRCPVFAFDELTATTPWAPHVADEAGNALAAIMFTSGTTSKPKGVRVTHANYRHVGTAVAEHLQITAADRWLVTLPLFHANAQYYCVMSALAVGGSVALTARFSASLWPRQARFLRPTLASLFAAPIRMILARSEFDPSDSDNDLRLVLFAQNLAERQAAEFESRFGAPLVQLYGMTETVLPPFANPLDHRRRWDSIGLPLPGVMMRVVDQCDRPVPTGAAGELQIRGVPGVDVTEGYDGRPADSAALFTGGWLRTGDLVRLDDQGRAYFVDRVKDMVKRAGENIAVSEVERVLAAHPAVLECAVHGIPDPVYDEAIVAHVVLRPDIVAEPEMLLAWCQARLSRFKVPDRVVIRNELPRTSVGKIRKDVLRTEFSSRSTK